jgi:hypothetical protein
VTGGNHEEGTGGQHRGVPRRCVADAQAREKYLQAFTCPFGDGYDYLDGAALLRLDCALTPAQAQANEALFKKVLGAA